MILFCYNDDIFKQEENIINILITIALVNTRYFGQILRRHKSKEKYLNVRTHTIGKS
jgi:hypothetical protein